MTTEHNPNVANATPNPEPFKEIVIITGGNPVFVGLFGELDSINEGQVMMRLDQDLKGISTALEAYSSKAYAVPNHNATIVSVHSQAEYNSLKATLANMNAAKWNQQYDRLKMSGDDFMRVALEHEQNKMAQGVETLIANTGAQKEVVPLGLFIIPTGASDTYEDETEAYIQFLASNDVMAEFGQNIAPMGSMEDLWSGDCSVINLRLGQAEVLIDLSDGHEKKGLVRSVVQNITSNSYLSSLYLGLSNTQFSPTHIELDPETALEILGEGSYNPLPQNSSILSLLRDMVELESSLDSPTPGSAH